MQAVLWLVADREVMELLGMLLVGGPAVIRGQVSGDLVAVGGSVGVSAQIMGDLVIVGSTLKGIGAVTSSEVRLTLKEAAGIRLYSGLRLSFP